MTRRILAAFLALTGALLGAAVLPLGLESAAHYRRDYADSMIGEATAIASVAEERLADHRPGARLHSDLRRFVDQGGEVLLLNPVGALVDRAGGMFPVPSTMQTTSRTRSSSLEVGGETLLLTAVPIGPVHKRAGVVVLARSTEPLESRIRTLWLTLAGVAVASTVAAVLLAVWLSRWVARPLRRLEEAARFVGAGNLEARADVVKGPPEVRRLAATFDSMAARLSMLLDGHRAVIADVSHQLRTPMSALRLRLELLTGLDRQEHTHLLGALDELNRLSRLVDGSLAVARAEATTQRPAPVDIRPVISARVSAWTPLATERRVDLTLLPGPEIRAWTVPGHLEQIVDNLLANCFDLEPPPKHIRLRLSQLGDNVRITVADDGPGMTEEQRERAFQRFTTNHAQTGGIGLGLAIVQRLITTGGGSVGLEESPGSGLTVVLTLPRMLRSREDKHVGETKRSLT